MLQNSLYAVNKYGVYKDDNHPLGQAELQCWDVQAFLLYLLDCGFSVIIGKPRQIGSTTVITAAKALGVMIRRNYYCKLVAQKGSKSEEIFKDKVKFIIENVPEYLKPTVANYNELEVMFKYQNGKGSNSTSSSRLQVSAPSEDVVNAGTPASVLLDEAGLLEILQEIINQGRPTQFWLNPNTGELEYTQQIS